MPAPAKKRRNPLQPGRLEETRQMSRSTADPLGKRPLRGGSGVRTAEVFAWLRPRLPRRLTRAGCFLPLSVRVWRLRRPPTFHGKEGGAHRLGTWAAEKAGQRSRVEGRRDRQEGVR